MALVLCVIVLSFYTPYALYSKCVCVCVNKSFYHIVSVKVVVFPARRGERGCVPSAATRQGPELQQ